MQYRLPAMAAMAFFLISSSVVAACPAHWKQTFGDITFVTGGIGKEERAAFESVKKEYNLRVTNAAVSGAYLADISLKITDSEGLPVFQGVADTLFYAQMPQGKYTVEARLGEQEQHRVVTVSDSKPAAITFRWK